MARLLGPDPSTRRAQRFTAGRVFEGLPGKTVTVYTDLAATQLADIAAYQPGSPGAPGATVAGSVLVIDQDSMVPLFWFPDTVDTVWAVTRDGYKIRLTADVDARLDAAATAGAAAAAAAGQVDASDPKYGTRGSRTAFVAALDAAEALGKHTVVRVPAGLTIDVGAGLSLSGYSVQIIGAGAGLAGSTPTGSVIKASTQTGPVLDFTGYVTPANFKGKVTPLAAVAIVGSGVADPTKNNAGIRLRAMSSAIFRDIAISNTGGPGLECVANPGNAVYLSDFERIVISTPVSAKTNDVPWFYACEPNGNRFRGFGFRSVTATGDVGPSGAIVIEGNGTYTPHDNHYESWWFEFLHPPTSGTLFHHAGNTSVIENFQFFDCSMEAGSAGGTSFIRLATPTVNSYGGNTVRGFIHGDNGTSTYLDTGVDVQQSRNRIEGIRGYRAKNVTIAAGVDYTYAHLAGGQSGAANSAYSAFVVNSTATHNVLIDELNGDEYRNGRWTRLTGVAPARTAINVKEYGAAGDGSTDDTAAITAAITAVKNGGGGCVYFPHGTFVSGPQVLPANVELRGESRAGSVLQLAANTNLDFVVTENFATLTGGTQSGPQGFSITSLTIDGNRTGQTSRARCFVAYGYNYTIRDVWFVNGYGGGVYSEWGGSATPMESLWDSVKVWNYGGTTAARGIDWNGPHDSKMNQVVCATLDSTIRPTDVAYGATPINGSTVTFPGTGVQFTFVTTAAAPTTTFPANGGTFVVPVFNSLDTWATVTYTSAATVGSVTTFSGCTAPVPANRNITASKGIVQPTYGLAINLGAGTRGETGLVLANSHFWGRNHFAVFANAAIFAANTECEGAFIASLVLSGGSTYTGGAVYGTNGQTGQENEIGIQIGWTGRVCSHSLISTHVHNVGGTSSSNSGAVFVSNSGGGNVIRVLGITQNPTRYVAPYSGAPDVWEAYCQNSQTLSVVVNYTSAIAQSIGGVKPGTGTGGRIYSGSGVPNITTSQAGDYWFRTDTPSTAGQRIYIATGVNVWTATSV